MLYRTIVTPMETKLTIELPQELVGKSVEVLAFEVRKNEETIIEPNDVAEENRKRTFEEAAQFWNAHAIDFSKFEKWKRNDLYE